MLAFSGGLFGTSLRMIVSSFSALSTFASLTTLKLSRCSCKDYENHSHRCSLSIHCCGACFPYWVCFPWHIVSYAYPVSTVSSALSCENINLSRHTSLCWQSPLDSKSPSAFGLWSPSTQLEISLLTTVLTGQPTKQRSITVIPFKSTSATHRDMCLPVSSFLF